jgi:uncharacterized protein YndB with AHSA1/START domain
MMSSASAARGRLSAVDGAGVVSLEDRYDTGIEDMWTALTDPERLARWYGQVQGDLRPGGEFRLYVPSAELESTGRIEVCEQPNRLVVTTRETDESWRHGNGEPPFDGTIEATLTADGDQTIVRIEIRGLPLKKVAFYAAGWQIHTGNLAAHVTGSQPVDAPALWAELVPQYQDQAAGIA